MNYISIEYNLFHTRFYDKAVHWYVIVGYHYLEDLFKNANSYLNEYIIKTPIFMVYAHIIHQIERENQPDMHVTFS